MAVQVAGDKAPLFVKKNRAKTVREGNLRHLEGVEMGRAARVQAESRGGVCMLWQGSGSGGAAEQGRATFMHLS